MADQPTAAIPSVQKQNEMPTYGTGVWMSYKIDFRTRVRSSLRSLARFLRIMSQPSHDLFEEFKGLKAHVSDVETYYYFLSSLYKSADTWSLDRNRWMITKISTYKSTALFEHECLVADVECEGQKVYLRFERKRSKKQSKASSGGKTPSKAQASDDSDPPSDDLPEDNRPTGGSSSSSSRRALDTVIFSKSLETIVNPTECVEVLQFAKGKGLSLSQITVLARCVNNTGRMYSLLKANCYWFAHLVAQTTKLIEPDCKAEAKSNKKPGEWLSFLPITKKEPDVIQEVKVKYDELWASFNEDIHKSVNNEDSPIYKQALKREEEERRKREEAERLEKEERKAKEEERRRREEAERLEKEERKAKEEERKAKEEERRKREEAERLQEEAERKAENAEEEIKKLKALLAAKTDGANNSS